MEQNNIKVLLDAPLNLVKLGRVLNFFIYFYKLLKVPLFFLFCSRSNWINLAKQNTQQKHIIRIIRNQTKFEHAKEHFIFEGLPNICKLYIFGFDTTVYLQILVVQKPPFPLLFDLFKEILMYIQQILCNKILSKKSR